MPSENAAAVPSLTILGDLLASEWFERATQAYPGDVGDLLRAISHDAADQGEELRRSIALWQRQGLGKAGARMEEMSGRAILHLVMEARENLAKVLEDAAPHAPSADVANRFREVARNARAHASRIGEFLSQE
jgi:hypothetical protein